MRVCLVYSQNWFKNNRAKRRRAKQREHYTTYYRLVLKQSLELHRASTKHCPNNLHQQRTYQSTTTLNCQSRQILSQNMYMCPENYPNRACNRKPSPFYSVVQHEADFPPNAYVSMTTQRSYASSHADVTSCQLPESCGITQIDCRMI